MNTLKKIKLSNLSKDELGKRELNRLLGGANCCICSCPSNAAKDTGGNSLKSSDDSGAGYGVGSYA